MIKITLALLAVSVAAPALAQSSHFVDGYTRRDGSYVAPHMQTNPDGNIYNNWSTQGNVNPYTGVAGTVNPGAVSPPNAGYNGSRRSGYGWGY